MNLDKDKSDAALHRLPGALRNQGRLCCSHENRTARAEGITDVEHVRGLGLL